MINYGTSIMYSALMGKDKVERRKAMKVSEVAKESSQQDLPTSKNSLVLVISCSDDIEIPFVQYRFK
jgi:ubiquitin-activating enzyme E1